MSAPAFIPGRELARLFFAEAVQPVLAAELPGLRYGAALLHTGSEVLGFDTEMSADHGWGPRVDLFLRDEDYEALRDRIDAALRRGLPHRFRGWPTSFSEPDPVDHGTQHLDPRDEGPVHHEVVITAPRRFVREYLGYELAGEIEPADWLTFPSQKLRTVTDGPVFRDGAGLGELRARLAWYPQDVWLYLLAAGWTRIGQEEHLMGRAGIVGDEVGSAVIGARLVRDVMRLCFLMERVYAPYPKWFGTAFARLRCGPELLPHLSEALAARTWREREHHLVTAYEAVARMHAELALTDPLPTAARDFHGRPFRVMALHGFERALLARVRDERVRHIAARPVIGSVDQLSDSTDLLANALWRERVRRLYEER